MPRLGQGTWRMGESARRRAEEVAALKLGLNLSMTLIDTEPRRQDHRLIGMLPASC
jgi:diketogulonate reductase-like aldo/keto reductase